mgnify:CR=1 FL=1
MLWAAVISEWLLLLRSNASKSQVRLAGQGWGGQKWRARNAPTNYLVCTKKQPNVSMTYTTLTFWCFIFAAAQAWQLDTMNMQRRTQVTASKH